MIDSSRARNLYTAAAVALLLMVSVLSGYVAAAAAVALLAVGALLFPEMRRVGLIVALVGAGVAIALVLLRTVR
jgi:O-antigen ligase